MVTFVSRDLAKLNLGESVQTLFLHNLRSSVIPGIDQQIIYDIRDQSGIGYIQGKLLTSCTIFISLFIIVYVF